MGGEDRAEENQASCNATPRKFLIQPREGDETNEMDKKLGHKNPAVASLGLLAELC